MVKFTKMQGCGNDYVYINNDVENIQDKSEFTKRVSNRNFGIGSDGCIFISSTDEADIAMEIYNVDGSEASMCGNGIRCVAKYVYEKGIVVKDRMKIKTKSGIKNVDLNIEEGKVQNVKVNMGVPKYSSCSIGVKYPKDIIVNERFNILDRELYLTILSVGNVHTIAFVDNVEKVDIEKYGAEIERLNIFEDRTNVEFVEVVDRENIKVRVWERGVGETLACGTGATASVIAGYLNGVTDNICNVYLKGGKLEVVYNEITNVAYLIGKAEFVYEGKLYN